jgi:hypothetical protein
MDDDNNQGSSEEPKKRTDFAKLVGASNKNYSDNLSPENMRSMKEAARATDAIKSAVAGPEVQNALKSLNAIDGPSGVREAAAQMDAIRNSIEPTNEMVKRIRALTGQFGSDSGIGKVMKQIGDQQRSIDALRLPSPSIEIKPPEMRDLHIPPNPIHETNARLERIEQRFEQILDVAANGAAIATGLQAHAAEFLVKFEKAATDNDRSAARAIRLGSIAVIIALAMPLAQILYTELWRVPQDSASMETVITDMQTEMTTLRQNQIEAADRIAAALERSDQQMVDALRDVASSLAAPPPVQINEPRPGD